MKTYETPELEIIKFSKNDVIETSTMDYDNNNTQGNWDNEDNINWQ